MAVWKNKLVQAARYIDNHSDKIRHLLRKRLGSNNPIHIVPYRTYGTPRRIYIRGRVLEDKGIAAGTKEDTLFANLLNMYRRFESNEVPGAILKVTLPEEEHTVITDQEGYFVFDLNPKVPVFAESLYHEAPLTLVDAPYSFQPCHADAEIMIPPADAEYGIISDIDDTVIRTGATSLLAMGKTVLLANAKTRLPYPGVSEFYKALLLGRNGKGNNPFFYVSSSPWNLYDLLIDFMDYNEIPAGPLLLRDFGIQSESFTSGNYLGHKFKEISQILDTYPHLNFVLLGDSGEQDPPIYLEVVKHYPGRILAIYIRDVVKGEKHDVAQQVAKELKTLDVEMILTEDSVQAAEHAATAGLIFREKIEMIEQDKLEDEGVIEGKSSEL